MKKRIYLLIILASYNLQAPTSYVVARTVLLCAPLNEIEKFQESNPEVDWFGSAQQDLLVDHDSTILRREGQPITAHNRLRTADYTRTGALKTDDAGKVHNQVMFVREFSVPEHYENLPKEQVTTCREYFLVTPRP